MIIKYKTIKGSWVFEEGQTAVVSRISFEEKLPENYVERFDAILDEAQRKSGIPLKDVARRIVGDAQKTGRVAVVSLFDENSGEENSRVFLFFDGVEAYLLNNRGNTIERII